MMDEIKDNLSELGRNDACLTILYDLRIRITVCENVTFICR